MPEFPTDNDQVLFDRLVDGELTAQERQQLLASLDDPVNRRRQDGWRSCALAFLEAQSWGREFKQIVAEPTRAPVVDDTPAPTPFLSTAPRSKIVGRFCVAAGLLLAFTLGWFSHSTPPAGPQVPETVAELAQGEPRAMPLRDATPEALSGDSVTLLVRDTSGNNQRLQVPLMEVGDLGEDLEEQWSAALPAKLRDYFRDRGLDLQRRLRFAPMFFEQNEQLVPMVVPVDDTYIVPDRRPFY